MLLGTVPEFFLTHHRFLRVRRTEGLELRLELLVKNRLATSSRYEPKEGRRRVKWASAEFRVSLEADKIWMV